MAEQGFTVRVSARVDQYVGAMGQAKKATKELGDSGRDLDKLGGKMQDVGVTMSKAVTVPLIGVGVAAVKMSTDFDSAFGRMVGLAGVQADEVDGLKESVLGLAGSTARSPQELADALYFLRSSGLDAGKAMDALEVSAKASAAGLGPTEVIADAVSSAMNAYAKSGLSAAEATDTLTATARAGKAEPAELAGALGRVLPIASELGITFQDVGGAIASLSLTGNDASTSATLLTNIMAKLLKPSQQSADALAAVGLSAGSIRQSIADDGLLGTLDMLRDKLGDAGFVKFMEDAQAVQGALSLTGQNAEHVSEVFADVKDSAGATDAAFAAMSDTAGFKMKQAWADVQVALIKAGDIILPIVSQIASGIASLADVFTNLPGPVQGIIVGFVGLVAAAGPVLMIGGSLVKNWNAMKTALTNMSAGATTAGVALGALGIIMIGATAVMADNAAKKARLRAVTDEFADALKREADGQKDAVQAAIAAQLSNKNIVKDAETLGLSVSQLADIINGKSVPAWDALNKAASRDSNFLSLGEDANKTSVAWNRLSDSLAVVKGGLSDAKDEAALAAKVNDELGTSTEKSADQVAKQRDVFDEVRGVIPGVAAGMDGVTKSTEAADKQTALYQQHAEAMAADVKRGLDEIESKWDELTGNISADRTWTNLQLDFGDLKTKFEDANEAMKKGTDDATTKALQYRSAVDSQKLSIIDYGKEVLGLPQERLTRVLAAVDAGSLDAAQAMLDNLTRNYTANVFIVSHGGAGYGGLDGARAAGGPVLAGRSYLVGEDGPEILRMGGPGMVYSNPDSQQMISASSVGITGSSGGAAPGPVVNHSEVNFNGGIHNTVDFDGAWRRANFALAAM
jgi:TP901 family phage tail tape measure protein